ncbi:MAG: DnaJ domain-containing protein [Scytonematopsis contorta HA4267-MV1]|jgi:Tfp pilus assembly protein PilF|nr:DnaJ domain-containing protein [Scytonematopsis contorta HA4267-MV1]
MAYELYQVLEVLPQSSPEEIKRAYYQLVRKYPPEKDPEKFNEIRGAYETLSDPRSRENYDSIQDYGEQISELFGQAKEKMDAKDWPNAIPLLKHLLVLSPGASTACNYLGICYIYTQEWDEAFKVYQALTKEYSDIALYWNNFGQLYKQQADSLDKDNPTKPQLYAQAREYFQKAIEHEQFNHIHYLDIAYTYLDEYNYPQALVWTEKAVTADGEESFDDLETLLFICRIHFYTNELQNFEATLKRIVFLVPEDEEAKKHTAYRFAQLCFEYGKYGVEAGYSSVLKYALVYVKTASYLIPTDADVQNLLERTEYTSALFEEHDVLKKDILILYHLQRLAAFCLCDYFNLYKSEEERKNVFDEIFSQILASPCNSIVYSVNRIKSKYSLIYQLKEGLFKEIEKLGQEQITKPEEIIPQPSTKTYSGWLNAFIVGSLVGVSIIIGFALNRNSQPTTPVINQSSSRYFR